MVITFFSNELSDMTGVNGLGCYYDGLAVDMRYVNRKVRLEPMIFISGSDDNEHC